MGEITYRIDADRALPGRGAPIPDACVLLEGARIAWVGPEGEAPSTSEHEELRAIVEKAARAERIVAAHRHGKADIRRPMDPANVTHVWKAGRLEKAPSPESFSPSDGVS